MPLKNKRLIKSLDLAELLMIPPGRAPLEPLHRATSLPLPGKETSALRSFYFVQKLTNTSTRSIILRKGMY